jgi:hypothetical protein
MYVFDVGSRVLYIPPTEEGKWSAGHELKGKPPANFPTEEGDICREDPRKEPSPHEA